MPVVLSLSTLQTCELHVCRHSDRGQSGLKIMRLMAFSDNISAAVVVWHVVLSQILLTEFLKCVFKLLFVSQIAACGYIDFLVKNRCWLIQLFSLACTIKEYSRRE